MPILHLSKEYFNDLMVRMAHHSTAIEGNTLTQGETKSILIDGYIPRSMDKMCIRDRQAPARQAHRRAAESGVFRRRKSQRTLPFGRRALSLRRAAR